jgi:Ca2+-dependent lipid-binding protein
MKKFVIPFESDERQQLKFEIWDINSIADNELMGQINVEFATILAKGVTYRQELATGGRDAQGFGGEFLIRAEKISSNTETATISFTASNLDKKDLLGKSDPYLVISKAYSDGSFSVVHRTEIIKNNLNPQWEPFIISVQQLCSGDYERTLKIECYDWDMKSGDDLIGSFITNLKKLSAGPSQQNVYEV